MSEIAFGTTGEDNLRAFFCAPEDEINEIFA